MPMDAREIELMIKAAIPDAEVTIRDLAGDGDHYAATVISASFRGKSRVQQHQIVYQSLKGQMGGVLACAGAADRGTGGLAGRGRHGGGRATRRSVSPAGAEPAQPGHLRRTVFRPRVRICGNADIAHAARPLYAARGVADDAVVSQRLVAVGLHRLDHQLARSREDPGSRAAVRADARRPDTVDLDSEGL